MCVFSGASMYNLCDEEEEEEESEASGKDESHENNKTREKMKSLKLKMENLSLNKKVGQTSCGFCEDPYLLTKFLGCNF